MDKKKFYIYQEDLIQYEIQSPKVTISQLVGELNKRYCTENMRKLRTETITNYLQEKGYLSMDGDNKKRPTQKGEMLGIDTISISCNCGNEKRINIYDEKAQRYILDNFYDIISNP